MPYTLKLTEITALSQWYNTPGLKLRTYDLETRTLSEIPGSEGMVLLYDTASKTWKSLDVLTGSNYWDWSHDGQYLYFDTLSNGGAAKRYRVKDGAVEEVASLRGVPRVRRNPVGSWFGLGPGDTPMVMRNTATPQIYQLDWEAP